MVIIDLGSFSRMVAAVIGVTLCSVSCHPVEQGYWTKQDISQAITNEQYPGDSRQCDRVATQNDHIPSEHGKTKLYTNCMQARGYQWIVERPHSYPAKSAGDPSNHVQDCPTGRIIIDAFGYDKCVPAGQKNRGTTTETIAHVTQEAHPAQKPESHLPKPTEETNERWAKEDSVCRQHSRDSLSSPYGVYAQCMQEKGWPSGAP